MEYIFVNFPMSLIAFSLKDIVTEKEILTYM